MFKKYVSAISICLLLVLMSTSAANAIESIIREAESANSITAPFVIVDDATASGGKYIVNPAVGGGNNSNPPVTNGIAKYNITITEGGTYKMFLRVICTVGGDNDDSCYVRITGATPSITPGGNGGWTNCNNIDGTMAAASTQVWFWAQVREYGTAYPGAVITFDIPKGSTTIEIAYREDGLKIDQLILTNDPDASTTNLPLPISSKPYPADNATNVSLDTKLWWKPGIYAETFNVFLGTDFNDVLNATVSAHEGVTMFEALDVNNMKPGMLEYGVDYYWRVDDIGTATNKGGIWKFTSEPEGVVLAVDNIVGVEFNSTMDVYDNQEPNTTYNGVGLDDVNGIHSNDGLTMWVGASDIPGDVWLQYELDQVYKLYQLKIWNYNDITYKDFGAKDVNVLYSIDNVTWKALDEIQVFPMATGESTYKADIFVDMNGALAKYVKLSFLSSYFDGLYTGGISEIKFLVIPTRAAVPSPANNATNVNVNSILSWKAGRGAAVHKIYVSSDEDSVIDRNSNILSETTDPNYPIVFDLGKTYYWRVDEVNEAEEYTIWDGPVWKFSTQQYILIDGFETGYGNDTTTNAVFLTWKDGAELGDSSNGAYMGRKSEPYLQTINHSGGHSAPMQYDNTSLSYSEVKAETSKLAIGSDWSKGNPGALVIWFRSDSNDVNEPATDRLYVELNDANKKIYDGPASYIRRAAWVRWEVPLTGISLGNVTSITIGVGRIGSTGGMGTLYLDDIMLTTLSPAPVNPGTTGLLAKYAMENNVQDTSGNGLNGTLVGTANGGLTFVDALSGYGKALVFDGNDDCVDLGNKPEFNPAGSFSVSLWAKINTWSTNWGHVMISNRGETTGGGWQIRRYSNSSLCFTTRGVGNDDTNSNATPGLNVWTNITCVYDSEAHTKSIYIDGVLDKTVDLTGTTYVVAATTHNTYIGARADSANTAKEGFFKGSLDQILIYNRALSAGEAAFLADPTP